MTHDLSVSSTENAKFRTRQPGARRHEEVAEEIKVYRSTVHPDHWIAYSAGTGWVIFPARANGWEERSSAKGLDPMYLRQAPLQLALDTGIMEAMRSSKNGKAA
jgi:hypothetical protein